MQTSVISLINGKDVYFIKYIKYFAQHYYVFSMDCILFSTFCAPLKEYLLDRICKTASNKVQYS